jgi:hypothetical protein
MINYKQHQALQVLENGWEEGSPPLMVISFAYLNDWSNAEII